MSADKDNRLFPSFFPVYINHQKNQSGSIKFCCRGVESLSRGRGKKGSNQWKPVISDPYWGSIVTELGHNTPLGRGGSLLTVVIILTRPVKPANVSRADGRAGWAAVVGSFCVFLLLHRPATGAERPATTPTEVDSGPATIPHCICICFCIYVCICICICIFCICICRKEPEWTPDLQQFLTSLECCRPWALLW